MDNIFIMIMISFFWKSNKILIVVIINFLWLYMYINMIIFFIYYDYDCYLMKYM